MLQSMPLWKGSQEEVFGAVVLKAVRKSVASLNHLGACQKCIFSGTLPRPTASDTTQGDAQESSRNTAVKEQSTSAPVKSQRQLQQKLGAGGMGGGGTGVGGDSQSKLRNIAESGRFSERGGNDTTRSAPSSVEPLAHGSSSLLELALTGPSLNRLPRRKEVVIPGVGSLEKPTF